MFEEAGVGAIPVVDIRSTLWATPVVNLSGSVIALATGNQSSVSRTDPELRQVYLRAITAAVPLPRGIFIRWVA